MGISGPSQFCILETEQIEDGLESTGNTEKLQAQEDTGRKVAAI
jgi:hypothetical protein